MCRKQITRVLAGLWAVVVLLPGTITAGDLDISVLELKKGDIAVVRQKVEMRISQASQSRKQLNQMKSRLTTEIQQERNRHNIVGYSADGLTPRIR